MARAASPWKDHLMRETTLVLIAVLWPVLVQAQVPVSYDLTFDPGADIVLDSIYPANSGWQVGTPNKTVLDSACSAPNALVTDTISPYTTGTLSYAQFHIPVNGFGEGIELSFDHRMDVETAEAFGWVEYYDPYAHDWTRIDAWSSWASGEIMYSGTAGIDTDSGLVFTGEHMECTNELIQFVCIGVFHDPGERGGGPDTTMSFRFVFQGVQNTGSRGGWSIDNVHIVNVGCMGGLSEPAVQQVILAPSPADDRLTVTRTNTADGFTRWEVFQLDGQVVLTSQQRLAGTFSIPTAQLPAGTYALRCSSAGTVHTVRFAVQH